MDYNPYARFGVNMTPMQAPPQMWQQAIPQPPRQVTKVSGMEGARSFAASMPPNSTDAVFDADRDVFYFLSTDGGGFPTVRPFSFSPFEEAQGAPQQFVTRDEFESAISRIQEMVQNAQQPVQSAAKPTAKPTARGKSTRTTQSD